MMEWRDYLYAWNEWVVQPGFFAVAIWLAGRYRSVPTILMAAGFAIYLLAKSYLQFSGLSGLDSRYFLLLAIEGVAFAMGSAGFFWFLSQSTKAGRKVDR